MKFIASLLLTALTLLSGCELEVVEPERRSTPPVRGEIGGKLESASGAPVAGSVVRLDKQTNHCALVPLCSTPATWSARDETVSDEWGRYEFRDLPIGTYRVVVIQTRDHVGRTKDVSIRDSRRYTVDMVLRRILQRLELSAESIEVDGREFLRVRARLSNDSSDTMQYTPHCTIYPRFQAFDANGGFVWGSLSPPTRPCRSFDRALLAPGEVVEETADFGWRWRDGSPSEPLPAGGYTLVARVTFYSGIYSLFSIREELPVDWSPATGP